MKFKHILITGGSGLLALNWACVMRQHCRVTLAVHNHEVNLAGVESIQVNLDSLASFDQALELLKPDLIVHTAGLTQVDDCESDQEQAHHANVQIAAVVAKIAAMRAIQLVHISTDHIFNGLTSLSTELTAPHPLNVYASTKLKAEEVVLDLYPLSLVLRTNFFGWGSGVRLSFSDWVIQGLRSGVALPMFEDVFFTPILVDELAHCAHELLTLKAYGIFNVVGSQRVSKYEYAVMLAEVFELPQTLIHRAKLIDSKLKALRPKDMSLSNARLVQTIGRQPGNLDTWFKQLLSQEKDGRKGELEFSVSRRGKLL